MVNIQKSKLKGTFLNSTILNGMRAFALTLLLLLVSCQIAPPTSYDYDQKYDFSGLKTYAWIKPREASSVTTLNDRRQKNAIETILNRKGYQQVNTVEAADFFIREHIITDKQVDVNAFYSVWGYYPYYYHPYGYGMPYQQTATIVREYEVGTLILDIIDPAKMQVIWQGSVSRQLGVYQHRSPEERASIALTNAEYLLASFPPDPPVSH